MTDQKKQCGGPGLFSGSAGFRLAVGICGALALGVMLLRQVDTGSPVAPIHTVHEMRPIVKSFAPHRSEFTAVEVRLQMAIDAWRAEPDWDQRHHLWIAFANSLAPDELPAALAFLQKLDDEKLANQLSDRLLVLWGESDPGALAAWATQLPAGELRGSAMFLAAIHWAKDGFEDAAAWVRQLPDPVEKNILALIIVNEGARVEPVEALRLALELDPDKDRDNLIHGAAMEWASQDSRAAVDWARQIPDPTFRELVLGSIAVVWSNHDPADAAFMAVSELSSGRNRENVLISIAQRWAQQDPERAAAWAETFFTGELRVVAIQNVASIWSQDNPSRAEQWQRSLIP